MKENEAKMQKKGGKAIKIILNTIINILIVAILVVSVTIAVMSISSKANDGVSVIFGHTIENIQTDSMKGGSPIYDSGDFEHGDVIIGLYTNNDSDKVYAVGDIITYKNDLDKDGKKENVCHRIIEADTYDGRACYRTMGDNGELADQDQGDLANYITASDISSVFYSSEYQGKIIKGLGNVLTFLQSKFGFFICVLLPMIIFFMYELIRVVFNVAYYRKAREQETNEAAGRERQAEIDAAVAEALANQKKDSDTDMTPEQMEQFKQFLEFQKKQNEYIAQPDKNSKE